MKLKPRPARARARAEEREGAPRHPISSPDLPLAAYRLDTAMPPSPSPVVRLLPAPPPPAPVNAPPDLPGSVETAAVLLVLQAALGLVSAAGVIFLTVLSGGAPLYLLASLAALAGPILALLLARGLRRLRRWARNGALVYQTLILTGSAVRFFFDREVALSLMVTLTGVALPLTIAALVLTPAARRAIAPRRRRPATVVPAHPVAYRPAA